MKNLYLIVAILFYSAQVFSQERLCNKVTNYSESLISKAIPAFIKMNTKAYAIGTELLSDTGLELTGAGGNQWTSTSTNYGTVVCSLALCGTGNGYMVPKNGSWYAWFGGAAGNNEIGTLSQNFTVSDGVNATLSFWWKNAPNAPLLLKDSVMVYIDNTLVVKFDNTTYVSTDYSKYTGNVTLSSGQHTIRFIGYSQSGTDSNFAIDDISLTVTQNTPVTPPTPTIYLKVTLNDFSFNCVSTDMPFGDYYVKEGECFVFRFNYEECCALPYEFKPIVLANKDTLEVDQQGYYSVCDINKPIQITIIPNDPPEIPVGNEMLNKESKVWSNDGKLFIYSAREDSYAIYNIAGQKVKEVQNVSASVNIPLSKGVYLIKAKNGKTYKAIVQ